MKDVRDPRASKMKDHRKRNPGPWDSGRWTVEGLERKRNDQDKAHKREIEEHVGKVGA